MTDFLTADTNLPSYMMFPRFLLDMEINETAKNALYYPARPGKAFPEKMRLVRYRWSCVHLLYD